LLQVEKIKGEKPGALKSKPEEFADMTLYLKAFITLSRSRGHTGGGAQPISIQDMQAYCEMFHVTDKDYFIEVVQALDNVYAENR